MCTRDWSSLQTTMTLRRSGGLGRGMLVLARWRSTPAGFWWWRPARPAIDAFIPEVERLSDFMGDVIHSTEFKSGEKYRGKRVLVVGSGNSGMEIALDLSNHSGITSIAIRSPVRSDLFSIIYTSDSCFN